MMGKTARQLSTDDGEVALMGITRKVDVIDLTEDDIAPSRSSGSIAKRKHTSTIHEVFTSTLAHRAPAPSVGMKRAKRKDLVVEPLVHKHKWLGEMLEVEGDHQFFGAMSLDGVQYSVGDAVKIPIKGGIVKLALIRSLSESSTEKSAHVHWLEQSRLGCANEYFLSEGLCSDVPLRKLSRRVILQVMTGKGKPRNDHPFIRFVLDESRMTVRDPVHLPLHRQCDSCHSQAIYRSQRSYRLHRNDLVLVDQNRIKGEPLAIGGVREVVGEEVRVIWWERVMESTRGYKDAREIRKTDREEFVPRSVIVGTALLFTSAEDARRSGSSSFWSREPFIACNRCQRKLRSKIQDLEAFQGTSLLPSLDFYAGGGGTVTGARGLFHSKLAVDIDPTCCDTLQNNHPGIRVLCQSLGSLRQATMRKEAGKPYQIPKDLRPPHVALPLLPRRGSVVLLTACPPCQGHTGANRIKRPDDRRNEELFGTLSEVDRIRPDFFLLENVVGFGQTRNDGVWQEGSEATSFVQVTLRTLVALGYQVRIACLDCRSYGSPQNRVRVFILAARSGLKLPAFPKPSHANPQYRHIQVGPDWLGPDFGYSPDTGLYPAITAEEAISDLPAFEYTGSSTSGRAARLPTFAPHQGPRGKVGFTHPIPYAAAPRNDFQRVKRGGAIQVNDQYTTGITPGQLATIMRSPAMVGEHGESDQGRDRRANPNRGFNTLLTTSQPGGMATGTIHWDQKRIFTIRERARAQGFPDDYRFGGDVSDADRMIGNAVNVDIAAAIYKQIVLDSILPWWVGAGRPQGDIMPLWREAHPITES